MDLTPKTNTGPTNSPDEPVYTPEELLAKYFKAYGPYEGEAEQTLAALNQYFLKSALELIGQNSDVSIDPEDRLKHRNELRAELRQSAERIWS